MDTKLQMTESLSILERFRHLFMSVLELQNGTNVLFLSFFPGHFFIGLSFEFSIWDLQIVVSALKVFTKDFPWNSFLVNSGMEFYRFLKALVAFFSHFFSLANTFGNRKGFKMKTDPKRVIWWGIPWGYLGPLKTNERLIA